MMKLMLFEHSKSKITNRGVHQLGMSKLPNLQTSSDSENSTTSEEENDPGINYVKRQSGNN